MSGHRRTARLTWLFGLTILLVMASPGWALAQQVNITPESSITPTDEITSWVFQMAIGVAILGGLALVGVLSGYLRFAPRFFGREAPKAPPGARPRLLPTMSGRQPGTVAPVPGRTGTAAATRPAPEPRREPAPAATAAAPTTEVAPAEPQASQAEPQTVEATARPTAPPAGEQATQADAVGQAEAGAPESRPSAKTREETGDAEAAPAPEATAEATESPAPSTETPAQAPAEAPATSRAGGAIDQETYSRVLQEQLDKGVDRRVAEGRARAAGVVAAKKTSQG